MVLSGYIFRKAHALSALNFSMLDCCAGEDETAWTIRPPHACAVVLKSVFTASSEKSMNKVVEKYGLKPVSRPKISLVRELDLSSQQGKENSALQNKVSYEAS